MPKKSNKKAPELKLNQLEMLMFERNSAIAREIQTREEILLGPSRRGLQLQEKQLIDAVKERLGIELNEYLLDPDSGELSKRG